MRHPPAREMLRGRRRTTRGRDVAKRGIGEPRSNVRVGARRTLEPRLTTDMEIPRTCIKKEERRQAKGVTSMARGTMTVVPPGDHDALRPATWPTIGVVQFGV